MKRKGFTLVELLAVIVILAVISIITVPMIGNVIEDSKKKALETSVYGIVETANYFAISNTGVHEFLFDETKQGETINGKKLNYSGSIDAEGSLYIDNDGNISLCLMNEDYYVYKNYNSGIYIGNRKEDSCKAEYDPLTNKYIAYLESEGTGSNVYSIEEVNNLVDGLETKIENNSTSINAITDVVNTNKSNIEAIQAELDKYALQEDLDTTNSNVSNINNQVSTNTENISNLQTTIENMDVLSSLIKTNIDNISTNATNITNLQSSLNSYVTKSQLKSWKEFEIDKKFSAINVENSIVVSGLENGNITDAYVRVGIDSSNVTKQMCNITISQVAEGFSYISPSNPNYYFTGYIYRGNNVIYAILTEVNGWDASDISIIDVYYR